MQRSFINDAIDDALAFCKTYHFYLPLWAVWSPDQWPQVGSEADEIRRCKLGWDVTDFGSGDFDKMGLLLFTLRNGEPGSVSSGLSADGKTYCEKLLLIGEGQITPPHFHIEKMEDIINRAGGALVLELWWADPETHELDLQEPVVVGIDGIQRTFAAGEQVVLQSGESITLPPYLAHRFYAQPGKGRVLSVEVSQVNDDERDNYFIGEQPRFIAIEENEPARYVLCTEYPLDSPAS